MTGLEQNQKGIEEGLATECLAVLSSLVGIAEMVGLGPSKLYPRLELILGSLNVSEVASGCNKPSEEVIETLIP